jgi:hypothetical protein
MSGSENVCGLNIIREKCKMISCDNNRPTWGQIAFLAVIVLIAVALIAALLHYDCGQPLRQVAGTFLVLSASGAVANILRSLRVAGGKLRFPCFNRRFLDMGMLEGMLLGALSGPVGYGLLVYLSKGLCATNPAENPNLIVLVAIGAASGYAGHGLLRKSTEAIHGNVSGHDQAIDKTERRANLMAAYDSAEEQNIVDSLDIATQTRTLPEWRRYLFQAMVIKKSARAMLMQNESQDASLPRNENLHMEAKNACRIALQYLRLAESHLDAAVLKERMENEQDVRSGIAMEMASTYYQLIEIDGTPFEEDSIYSKEMERCIKQGAYASQTILNYLLGYDGHGFKKCHARAWFFKCFLWADADEAITAMRPQFKKIDSLITKGDGESLREATAKLENMAKRDPRLRDPMEARANYSEKPSEEQIASCNQKIRIHYFDAIAQKLEEIANKMSGEKSVS